MSIEIIKPSSLPTRIYRTKAVPYIRFAKSGSIRINRALAELAGLTVGTKINFMKKDGAYYFFITDTADSFTMRGKPSELSFNHASLIKRIGDDYAFSDLFDKFPVFTLNIEVVKPTAYIVAGIDTYFKLIPPKKYEPTKTNS